MAKNVYDDGNSYARASFRFSVAVFAKVRENAARSRVNCAPPGSKSGEPLLNLNKPRRNVDRRK